MTTIPKLFQIMKHRLPLMIRTCFLMILFIIVILSTALIDTPQLVLLRPEQFLFLLVLFCLLLFLLLLQIYQYYYKEIPVLYWLISLMTTGFCSSFLSALVAFATVFDLKNVSSTFLSVCLPTAHAGNFWNSSQSYTTLLQHVQTFLVSWKIGWPM